MAGPVRPARPVGRPALEDKRRPRGVRFNDAEWDRLRDEAAALGVTIAALVRDRALPEEEAR